MAYRHLTDAECGNVNPLVQLTSHFVHDNALHETHGILFPSSSDQLVEQFLQETRAIPQTFRMDDLMREMHEIESQRALIPPVPASAIKDHLGNNNWATEYSQEVQENLAIPRVVWDKIIETEQNNLAVALPDWSSEYMQPIEEADAKDSANQLLTNVDDPNFAYSKFMKFIKQVGDGETIGDEESQNWSEEYLNSGEVDTGALSEGFNSNFWDNLQEEWKKVSEAESGLSPEYDEFYDAYKEYAFSEENPMFDIHRPLDKGKEYLEVGDLPSAVLCFEAAVKQEPENSEAWQLLGMTQAENEQDPNAICALKRCLQLEATNLKVIMALAVCYTNESYYNQASQLLVSWLKNHPRYSDVVPVDFKISGQVTSLLNPDQHKSVQDLYIKAAQRQPFNPDYEIQCGLGVLFNLSGEYDKAADCFQAALTVKPGDSRIWNKLGATLANGNKPEEAVEAYHHALNLVPGFIRARYNVGITCINLSAYKEAAEHFLIALNQQARGANTTNSKTMSQMSDSIWSTLRMCTSLMNRQDLRVAVDSRDLATLNQQFNINDF